MLRKLRLFQKNQNLALKEFACKMRLKSKGTTSFLSTAEFAIHCPVFPQTKENHMGVKVPKKNFLIPLNKIRYRRLKKGYYYRGWVERGIWFLLECSPFASCNTELRTGSTNYTEIHRCPILQSTY